MAHIGCLPNFNQKVDVGKINTMDELKQRLFDVWQGVQQSVLDNAIGECRKRLRELVFAAKEDIMSLCCDC